MAGVPVWVAVLTYRRPADLARVVPAVLAQLDTLPPGYDGRLLVVDNDAAGSAERAVWELGDARTRYLVEPRPGIAAARNRALAAGPTGGLLVFLDDDETPRSGWLPALLAAAATPLAAPPAPATPPGGCEVLPAAVAGPVVSVFDGELDPWIAAGGFFARRHRQGIRTGEPVAVAATNNLLLRVDPVRALGLRFTTGRDGAGGEDTRFTTALTAAGLVIVWCAEAVVDDHVPQARMTRRYVLARAVTTGNVEGLVAVEGRRGRSGWVARARVAVAGGARVLGGAGAVLLGGVSRSLPRRAGGARTAARGGGMLLAAGGVVHRPYRRATGGCAR